MATVTITFAKPPRSTVNGCVVREVRPYSDGVELSMDGPEAHHRTVVYLPREIIKAAHDTLADDQTRTLRQERARHIHEAMADHGW